MGGHELLGLSHLAFREVEDQDKRRHRSRGKEGLTENLGDHSRRKVCQRRVEELQKVSKWPKRRKEPIKTLADKWTHLKGNLRQWGNQQSWVERSFGTPNSHKYGR